MKDLFKKLSVTIISCLCLLLVTTSLIRAQDSLTVDINVSNDTNLEYYNYKLEDDSIPSIANTSDVPINVTVVASFPLKKGATADEADNYLFDIAETNSNWSKQTSKFSEAEGSGLPTLAVTYKYNNVLQPNAETSKLFDSLYTADGLTSKNITDLGNDIKIKYDVKAKEPSTASNPSANNNTYITPKTGNNSLINIIPILTILLLVSLIVLVSKFTSKKHNNSLYLLLLALMVSVSLITVNHKTKALDNNISASKELTFTVDSTTYNLTYHKQADENWNADEDMVSIKLVKNALLSKMYDSLIENNIPTVTKTDTSFIDWVYQDTNGDATEKELDYGIRIQDNIDVRAQWANFITLDLNGGSVDGSFDDVALKYSESGDLLEGSYKQPTKDNLPFYAWKDEKNNTYTIDTNGVIYDYNTGTKGKKVSIATGTTLTAGYNQYKYAVSLYGIGVDTYKDSYGNVVPANDDKNTSMTFGPALGDEWIRISKPAHIALANETATSKCIHNHTWEEIVADQEVGNASYYSGCIDGKCTKTIELTKQSTSTILNPRAVANIEGDGPSALCSELYQFSDTNVLSSENLRWHPNNPDFTSGDNSGTNIGGWGTSRIRAMLNGADSTTDTASDHYSDKNDGSTDINKSASIYTSTNSLLSTLPQVLQDNIVAKEVNYKCYETIADFNNCLNHAIPTGSSVLKTYDKLWLLSFGELGGGAAALMADVEGATYNRFKNLGNNGADRTPYSIADISSSQATGNGGLSFLRSVDLSSSDDVRLVSGSGTMNAFCGAYFGLPTSFAFCLSSSPYQVTLDLNGGSINGSTDNVVLKYNDKGNLIQGSYNQPTKDNLPFYAWIDTNDKNHSYTIDSDGVIYDYSTGTKGDKVIFGEDTTLTAGYNQYKYAVSLYGIGVDAYKDSNGNVVPKNDANNTSNTSMTFGPALGDEEWITKSKPAHIALADETATSKCIHNHNWEEITADCKAGNASYYQGCIDGKCTKTVELTKQSTSTILNPRAVASIEGDGPSSLNGELVQYLDTKARYYDNLRWHPNNPDFTSGDNFGTTIGGWGTSRIRAMLNGADSTTDTAEDHYSNKFDSSTDINKSASIYTSDNNLLSTLPQVLQDNIVAKEVNYECYETLDAYNACVDHNNPTGTVVKTTYDKLWLLSTGELGGTSNSNQEGTAYNRFKNLGDDRIDARQSRYIVDINKLIVTSVFPVGPSYLRSVDLSSSCKVRSVALGGITTADASLKYFLSFAFCIQGN